MNKSSQRLACLFILLMFLLPTAQLASAALPPLAAGTFPVGTIVVPMDNKQADRVRVYGLIHEFLRDTPGGELARVIEPPDVTMQTSLTPSGTVYQGGPFLIDQKFLSAVNQLLATSFQQVTVTRLTAPFTSNQIFFVRQPTTILVIEGIWGRTDYTLAKMGINYTLILPSVVENNPSIINQYSLVVVDCPGWYGNPVAYTPDRRAKIQAVYNTLAAHTKAGNEVIFTDIAIRDLNATFPGYINVDSGAAWTGPATVHNPPLPSGVFSGEFPSQYYNSGSNPNSIQLVTDGGGNVVSGIQTGHTQDVRILIDSNRFGIPYRYAILGFYFPFGNGIVEGLALHPQEQLPVGSPGFYATIQMYGDKFVHGPQVDYAVSITPPSVTVNAGQIANYTVTVSSFGGFSGPVNLQVSGIPANSTSNLVPSSVTLPPGGTVSANLAVFTTQTTPLGNYTITVTGTSTLPAMTRVASANLQVNAGQPNFSITAYPSLVIANVSSCVNATIAVTSIYGFTSPVTLNATGAPPKVKVTLYPSVITPPASGTATSHLQFCPAPEAVNATYTIVITGTSGPLKHSTSIQLKVQIPATQFNWLIFLLVILLLILALLLALLALWLSRRRGPRVAAPVVVPVKPVQIRPRALHVLPLPTIRCRFCGRIIPLNSVYCPFCGRPIVVLMPPPVIAMPVTRTPPRAIMAFALTLISGILVLLNAAALLSPSFAAVWTGIFFWIPILGVTYAFILGALIGLVLVLASVLMLLRHGALADVIVFPFAIFSLIIGGGFIAGMILGIVAGIIGALKR